MTGGEQSHLTREQLAEALAHVLIVDVALITEADLRLAHVDRVAKLFDFLVVGDQIALVGFDFELKARPALRVGGDAVLVGFVHHPMQTVDDRVQLVGLDGQLLQGL